MLNRRVLWLGLLAGLIVGVSPRPAWAVIKVLLPLQQVMDESDTIVVTEVKELFRDRPAAMLVVSSELKGKLAQPKLAVNLRGANEKERTQLLPRLAPDLPVVLFIRTEPKNSRVLAFSNGTWFQLLGTTDGQTTRWAFTHCEIYLPRTFAGGTADLQQIIVDVLAKKRKAPPPNSKIPPGLGPVVGQQQPASDANP